jgi:hypothetical protein
MGATDAQIEEAARFEMGEYRASHQPGSQSRAA